METDKDRFAFARSFLDLAGFEGEVIEDLVHVSYARALHTRDCWSQGEGPLPYQGRHKTAVEFATQSILAELAHQDKLRWGR